MNEENKAPEKNELKKPEAPKDKPPVEKPLTLDERMKEFSKQTADPKFKPDQTGTENEGQKIDPEKVGTDIQEMNIGKQIKIKMFVTFVCYVFSWLNTFILNMINKTDVPVSEMFFSDEEKQTLEPYMDDPRVLEFIDKIPGWVMGLAQVEFMLISKFNDVKDNYKRPEKTKKK